MTALELKTWIERRLKEAEPLDRPSEMDDPKGVAIKATKKLGLLGGGSGELLDRAFRVETPGDCAVVLIDCLAALPQADASSAANVGAMTAVEVAEHLGVSKETVYKLCAEGTMPHTRIGRRITITPSQLEEYQQSVSC